ncbi:MAG: GIDE domain-containing protein [Candidatus Acidiferrales bacterium]
MNLPFDTCASALAAGLSVDGGRIEFYTAIGAILGLFLFYRGFRMLQYKRLIQNTPFSRIRSASMGLVEVSGMAAGPQTVPAGITGEPCFYYRATAWELRESGNRREWKEVADESLYVPFFVEDPTGKLLVDAQGADLDVHRTFKDEFNTSLFGRREMVPASVTQFLLRNGVGASGELRLEEHCIQPGYPLFILGTLGENPDRGHRPPTPHVVAASSSIRSRADVSSLFGNGLFRSVIGIAGLSLSASTVQNPMSGAPPVSASAAKSSAPNQPGAPTVSSWSSVSMDEVHPPGRTTPAPAPAAPILQMPLATATAVADAPSAQAPPAAQRPEETAFDASVVIGKGTRNDPFSISSQSQREVVRSLGWKSALCIWAGPVLALVCLYILLGMLGWR